MEQPRRFWHVTFWMADGREYRRYVKCPYLVPSPSEHGGRAYRRPLAPGDDGWSDTHLAMTARLGALTFDGVLASYRVSPVPAERIPAIRDRAQRWTEIEALVLAA